MSATGAPAPPRIARTLAVAALLAVTIAAGASWLRMAWLAPLAIPLALMAAAMLALRRERRSLASIGILPARPGFWTDAAWGAAWAALSIAAVAAGMAGVTREMTLHPSAGFLVDLPFWLAVGVAEETMFRGYILATLREHAGPAAGAAVSSALFMLLHAVNVEFNGFAYLFAFVMGLLLAGLTVKRGSLGAAIGFHAAWNLTQGRGVFDLPSRGGETIFAAVLVMDLAVLWLLPPRRHATR